MSAPTTRQVFDLLYATGDFSMQEIKTWMDFRQQADLRDEFAKSAMQTLVQGYADCDHRHFDDTAGAAYKMADAMLKARQQ